jgi:hypothetical protein
MRSSLEVCFRLPDGMKMMFNPKRVRAPAASQLCSTLQAPCTSPASHHALKLCSATDSMHRLSATCTQ